MSKGNIIMSLVVACILVGGGAAYYVTIQNEGGTSGDLRDMADRAVTPVDNLDNGVVTVGVGTLRWASYFGLYEDIICVDLGDTNAGGYNAKGYGYAFDYYLKAANGTIKTHSHNSIEAADVENIGEMDPSIVIISLSVYENHKVNCDLLAAKCNVVVIDELEDFLDASEYKLNDRFVKQIDLLGKVLGKEARANELKSGIQSVLDDIRGIVKDMTSDKKVYVCGVSSSGAKSLDFGLPEYWALELANGTNIMSMISDKRGVTSMQLNVEEIAKLNPDIVFVDPTCKNMLTGTDSQNVMEAIIKSGSKIYVSTPYVWFGINYDNVLADTYRLINNLYGDSVIDQAAVDSKIDSVYKLFYGDDGSDVKVNMIKFFENTFMPDGENVVKAKGVPLTIGNEYTIGGEKGSRELVKV